MYVGMDQHKESIEIATADRRTAASCNRAEEVGVEPTRPYGQRILSPFDRHSPRSTTCYQVVFTDVSVVKATDIRLGLAT